MWFIQSFITNVLCSSLEEKKVLSIKSQVSGRQTNITQLIFQTSFVLEEPKNYKGNLAEM